MPNGDRVPPHSVERFRLTGPSRPHDPRITAARRDIADVGLAGALFAPHYVRPVERVCGPAATMMFGTPDDTAPAVSQLLPGEPFAVLDQGDARCWGYGQRDGYVGYVATAALACTAGPATHRVTAPATLQFVRPDIKTADPAPLPIGSLVRGAADGLFLALADDAGFVPLAHVAPIDAAAVDPVAVAETLIGMPYLWGGRGGGGIDCSGLVQLALSFAGIAAPRDSDQQRVLGTALAPDASLARGDLIFFAGHVGLMVDGARLIHANAHAMAVTVEPLATVTARIATGGADPILARRRLA